MYAKIHIPENNKYNNNKGSCTALAEYLDKENLDRSMADRDNFFDQSRGNVGLGEVINSIDSNKAKLGKKESKFYMITINPSEAELKHIAKQITGRDIKDIKDFTAGELKRYENALKNYTRDVMDGYAKNFNRGLNGKDILYFGKVEHERKYGRDASSNLIKVREEHIKVSKDDLSNIEFNKYYYADSHCRDVCQGLKQGDQEAIRAAAAEMVKNIPDNAVLVPMPSSVGYATYTKEMCEEIKKLNPSLDVSDVLKCNERQKLYELKKDGKEASKEFFNFHLSGNLPKDRPVYMVDNVLATGSTYVNAKEVIPDAKLAVYGINEDTKIKLAKIDQLHNLKSLNLPKAGDLKAGLQSHVHVIVSRKDITNTIKLSPLAKARNAMNEMPKGKKAQIGFDRNKFTETCEQIFDRNFGYKRSLNETFRMNNLIKNKLTNLSKDILVPEEYAKTWAYGEKAYGIVKALSITEGNRRIANYLHKNSHIINQLQAVSDSFKVNSEVFKYEIKNNTNFIDKLTNTDRVNFNMLNSKLQVTLAEKKEALKPINQKISEAHKAKDWKSLKTLKQEKILIEKPFNDTIKTYSNDLDGVLSKAFANDKSIGNIPLSSDVRHIDSKFYSEIANYQKEFTNISAELKTIHAQTEFLATYKDINPKELASKLDNLKESHFRAYGVADKMNSIEKNLDGLKNELYQSLRTIEGKMKCLDPAIYGKSLESAKLDVLFKIGVINRCQKDIKFSTNMVYDASKVITRAEIPRDPINIAKKIFQEIPVAKECMQAMQYMAAPQKALLDIAKKAISSVVQAGMGI